MNESTRAELKNYKLPPRAPREVTKDDDDDDDDDDVDDDDDDDDDDDEDITNTTAPFSHTQYCNS